jgi:hypothetical protein
MWDSDKRMHPVNYKLVLPTFTPKQMASGKG